MSSDFLQDLICSRKGRKICSRECVCYEQNLCCTELCPCQGSDLCLNIICFSFFFFFHGFWLWTTYMYIYIHIPYPLKFTIPFHLPTAAFKLIIRCRFFVVFKQHVLRASIQTKTWMTSHQAKPPYDYGWQKSLTRSLFRLVGQDLYFAFGSYNFATTFLATHIEDSRSGCLSCERSESYCIIRHFTGNFEN
jgi:hypothetical protein